MKAHVLVFIDVLRFMRPNMACSSYIIFLAFLLPVPSALFEQHPEGGLVGVPADLEIAHSLGELLAATFPCRLKEWPKTYLSFHPHLILGSSPLPPLAQH